MAVSKFTPAQVFKRFMKGESLNEIALDYWAIYERWPENYSVESLLRRHLLARDRRRKGKK
jgi:hypothetical protein